MKKTSEATNSETVINISKQVMGGTHNWFEIMLRFVDDNGEPVSNLASGTIVGSIKKVGSDNYELFSNNPTIIGDSTTDNKVSYSYNPFLSNVESFKFLFSGLPAGVKAIVTIIWWK
jgi:hypothetical protein